MKPRFLLASLVVLSFTFSCSSKKTAPERPAQSAQGSVDADLDEGDDLDSAAAADGAVMNRPENHPQIAEFSPRPKTRYQVMQDGFDRSNLMPTVNDFDPLDEPSPRLACYSAKAAAPNTVSEMVIKQMMVQIAGTTDYGPLFPGSLDHVETRLIIGKNNGWVNSQNLTNEIRQVFELAKAPGSLVIRIIENKFGIYQDIGAPAEVWIRKNMQGHLFFKVYRLNAERVRTEVFIGYCFLKGGVPNVAR